MSEQSFYDARAKERTKEAVQAVEARTSAEVVVALRWVSGQYRHVDYLFGFGVALLTLGVMLFSERVFPLGAFPLDVAVAFGLGALLSAKAPPLRRLMTPQSERKARVRTAARAAFVDLGISKTAGRTGILVYVSMFERLVEVVPDTGVRADALGPAWGAAVAELGASVARRPDLDRFLAALRGLGPVLEASLPRSADDVNELPDELEAG